MSEKFAIVAPMMSGKTTFMHAIDGSALARHVADSDRLVDHVGLIARHGRPCATWTATQWVKFNAERNAQLRAALGQRRSLRYVLVHGVSTAWHLSLPVVAVVLLSADEFERRLLRRPDDAALAAQNRRQTFQALRHLPPPYLRATSIAAAVGALLHRMPAS